VFSLIAIVPERELRKPILISDPEVSTQDCPPPAGAPPESTREPQAVKARPRPSATAVTAIRRRCDLVNESPFASVVRERRTGAQRNRTTLCAVFGPEVRPHES
jgi:hypothetical protein